ncbi:MAG: alanine--tRNA ligase [Endomicrobium sp.]|jgi:alanyl-tRNA synthetase|nr:alanine--tRNA ligase [Endomicrobium sp.]
MNKLSSKVRAEFLNFFENNGCVIIPSDSLIPSGDKTLLFTSAGMVQFKQHFLGQKKDFFTSATSCQKCFRTSDIEYVGITARHLTFFEMLGNFSFGYYFKKEAIVWAWEFLTKNMDLSKDKLYITVYKDDNEVVKIWKKIVPENRIIKMDVDTNFWNMGDIGPCGPCSEILIDLCPEMGCGKPGCGPTCSCDRYLEIWNLVFMQFDRQTNGSLKNLPRKNIDTGMGLERIVAAVNGKKNIFDTDLFMPIINAAADILKIKYEFENISKLRMIADHSRAITFLISDGILPSNEGRGYVLRKILRRALRQGKFYGYSKPFINELVPIVFNIMEPAYPELSSKLKNIRSIIKIEEEKFLETLESGSDILLGIMDSYKAKGISILGGKDIFKLYDTYGFPQDLVREIASENGFEFDEIGFKAEQKTAQEKSRAAWSGSGEKDTTFYSILHKKIGDTLFVGYDNYTSSGNILALIKDGKEVSELKSEQEGDIILSQTSFYAHSGGQISDVGKIENASFESIVKDVYKPIGSFFVHKVKVLKGIVKTGQGVFTKIDIEYRKQIARHHTATHILQKVLRKIFGEHVVQAGSLITDKFLRFDFTYFSAIKKEELIKIEKIVNSVIRANLIVYIETMDIAQARNAGAMALFGEKYSDIARTVSVKCESGEDNYSMELCGGTHINRTGEIGMFKIISEFSVAAGVRRIEAAVGVAAESYILDEENSLVETAVILNTSKDELISKAKKYVVDYKKLEIELSALRSSLISKKIDSYAKQAKNVNGFNFLSVIADDLDIKELRTISDQLKKKLKSIILLLVSKRDGKMSFIVSATEDYVKQGVNACKIAKAFAADIGGLGGGKPDFAQGGSKELFKVEKVLKDAQKYFISL